MRNIFIILPNNLSKVTKDYLLMGNKLEFLFSLTVVGKVEIGRCFSFV